MNSRRVFWLLFVVLIGALALRAPQLGLRPMHGDEAIHADKFNTLWTTGKYQYNPTEYHGPTIYYLAWPIVALSGAQNFAEISATMLRLVPLLCGVSLIGMLWLCRDGFGARRGGLIWAAIFIALSPIMVFYSRYFIQEMALVAFSFAAFACLWRAYRCENMSCRRWWLSGGGASLGAMFASKETAILAVICALMSLGITAILARRWHISVEEMARLGARFRLKEIALVLGVAIVLDALLLSTFGRNPRGALDGILTYTTYFSRAGAAVGGETQGALHNHPQWQYFEWLLWFHPARGPRWTEVFPFVLSFFALFSLLRRPHFAPEYRADTEETLQVLAGEFWLRLVGFYALAMALMYALIPYKTPWCALGFWHGFLILGGIGAARLLHFPNAPQVLAQHRVVRVALQVLAALILLAGSVQLGMQSWASDVRFYVDPRNPWVYAHPVPDVQRLGERVQQLATFTPQKEKTTVLVLARGGDYWPLPWELRALPNSGFFEEVPANLAQFHAPVIVVAQKQLDEVNGVLGRDAQKYHSEFYGLRRGVNFVLLVENGLWEKFLKTR